MLRIKSLIQKTENTIISILKNGIPLAIAYSAGKDSSSVASLVLLAAKLAKGEGVTIPPIVFTNADTGIENPEMSGYSKAEIARIKIFAAKHNLPVSVAISEPYLNDHWAVQIIGGRSIPAFPCSGNKGGQGRDCTIDYKLRPQLRVRKQLFKELSKDGIQPVTVIGTRFSESSVRYSKMKDRGECSERPWKGEDGNLYLSPIADWTSDNVWEYLGMCKNGQLKSYSDFKETFRLYTAGSDSSCAVVADMATGNLKKSRGCGARFGCVLCCVTEDKSLFQMIENDPDRYGYMQGLNFFQQFLLATQYDLSRRMWMGRTINDQGFLAIRPDIYSSSMLEELLRYALTVDVREAEEAVRLGINKRFQLVTSERLIAIDASWALQGYFDRPHHALKIYEEIYLQGQRYDVPKIKPFPKVNIPAARYLYVGSDWDQGKEYKYTGLRNCLLDMFRGEGCMGNKVLPNGTEVLDVDTAPMFSVDPDGAMMVLELELDYLVRRHDKIDYPSYLSAYTYYVQMGVISIAKGKEYILDRILRRTNFKIRAGLVGQNVKIDDLRARSVSKSEMEKGLKKTFFVLPKRQTVPVQLSLPFQ